jgi:hypothetical protein
MGLPLKVKQESFEENLDVMKLQPPVHAGSSLVDLLYPEDGGDTFL